MFKVRFNIIISNKYYIIRYNFQNSLEKNGSGYVHRGAHNRFYMHGYVYLGVYDGAVMCTQTSFENDVPTK